MGLIKPVRPLIPETHRVTVGVPIRIVGKTTTYRVEQQVKSCMIPDPGRRCMGAWFPLGASDAAALSSLD